MTQINWGRGETLQSPTEFPNVYRIIVNFWKLLGVVFSFARCVSRWYAAFLHSFHTRWTCSLPSVCATVDYSWESLGLDFFPFSQRKDRMACDLSGAGVGAVAIAWTRHVCEHTYAVDAPFSPRALPSCVYVTQSFSGAWYTSVSGFNLFFLLQCFQQLYLQRIGMFCKWELQKMYLSVVQCKHYFCSSLE